jgi:uncharacterized protein
MKSPPRRTCLGCRRVRPQAELIRLARGRDGRAALDLPRSGGRNGDARGTSTGRGAYACPALECLVGALRKGRLDHAFRRPTEPPAESAEAMLAAWNSGKGETLWRDG